MRRTKRILALLLLAALVLLPVFAFAAEDNGGAPDYGLAESWAYFALGEDTGVGIFSKRLRRFFARLSTPMSWGFSI